MVNALFEYLMWQTLIWTVLIGWICFVAKLGERKAMKDRRKRGLD